MIGSDLVKKWIQEDYNENFNLINMKAISIRVPESPRLNKILIPEYRVEGQTKKASKDNSIITPTIPQEQIDNLFRIREENETLKQQIQEVSKVLEKYASRNKALRDAAHDTKKNIDILKNETNEKEKLNLIKIENERRLMEQMQKEKNRSSEAQSIIFKKNIELKAKLERLTQQELKITKEIEEFNEAKIKQKKILKHKIELAKKLNEVLLAKCKEVEQAMVKDSLPN